MIAINIPKTHYSTVSYARMMSVDMPFAEHNRGTPFGQKNGPAIAIVGAGSMIGAGITAGGFLGGLMIAGGVMSGLGAITGNKMLSTMGMVAGLAGGVGVGLSNSMTGEFMNPFAEGFKFADTNIGGFFDGLKSSFTPSTTGAAEALGVDGGSIVDSAVGENLAMEGGNSWNALESDMGGLTNINGESVSMVGRVADKASNLAGNLVGKQSDSGLLGSLLGNKDAMGLVKGAADAYGNYEDRKQAQPLVDARVDNMNTDTAKTQQEMDLLKQRQANMQAQTAPIAGVNDSASIYTQAPVQQNKFAANIGGKVMMVTQAELDAYRSQQGGLLNQGATA